jgi:hypothetical protein
VLKRLRIAILLFILLSVALSTWRSHARLISWNSTLYVAIYPINADGSGPSQKFVNALQESDLEPIADYLEEQASRNSRNLTSPIRIIRGPEIKSVPPEQPHARSALDAIAWSLKMRYWAWRNTPRTEVHPDVRLYLLYCDPALRSVAPDSAGLEKGQMGVAYQFASPIMRGSNLVVATHELLHTFGATDKYDPATDQPIFPSGYADPGRTPRLPQQQAEIMAGRIPLNDTRARMPTSLNETVIGPQTAAEIGWNHP